MSTDVPDDMGRIMDTLSRRRMPLRRATMIAGAAANPPRSFLRRERIRYAWRMSEACAIDFETLHFILDQLASPTRREMVIGALAACQTDEERGVVRGNLDVRTDLDVDDAARLILRAVALGNPEYDVKRLRRELRVRLLAAARDCRQGVPLGSERVHALARLFRLDRDDVKLLGCALNYRQCESFENLCDKHGFPEKLDFLSTVLRMGLDRLQGHISSEGRLAKCGIMNPITGGRRCDFFELEPAVRGYLVGIEARPLIDHYCKAAAPSSYGLDTFPLSGNSVGIAKALLASQAACHILLHGEPGTGKTEFAKALSAAAGSPAYLVNQPEMEFGTDRRQALHATLGMAAALGGIVIVDEADDILNTRYSFLKHVGGHIGKGWLNDFLDEAGLRMIWITNDISSIEESTSRRFTYSIKFPPTSLRQRQAFWFEHGKRSPLAAVIDAEVARDLSAAYPVNAAGVATAVQLTSRVLSPEAPRTDVVDTLREALDRQQELLGHQRGKMRPVDTRYDLEALNTSPDIHPLIGFLQNWQATPPPSRRTANLLFWGLPGTGKTEFAKYLARQLGVELVLRRASDLLSMWVGGTEKQIKEAFEEAERDGSILLLDEADSFFISRDTAVRSWESSQTNELLTQMENYRGILICCTNRLDSLDRAALRRFAWKVQFRPLTEESRLRLYPKYFGPAGDGMPHDLRRRMLALPDLTAGDLKAVSERFSYGGTDAISHADIVAALEDEIRHRRCSQTLPIGFQ